MVHMQKNREPKENNALKGFDPCHGSFLLKDPFLSAGVRAQLNSDVGRLHDQNRRPKVTAAANYGRKLETHL